MRFDYYGGRRFLFAIGLTCLSAFLLFADKLSGNNFVDIVNFNVVALVAGHTADKFANRISNDKRTRKTEAV